MSDVSATGEGLPIWGVRRGKGETRTFGGVSSRSARLTLYFMFALYPFSIGIIGANYSFVLLPLMVVLARTKISRPPPTFLAAIVLYVVILLAATAYQVEWLNSGHRRLASFTLFMSIFAYSTVRVDSEMMRAFKAALVGTSLVLSVNSIFGLVALGNQATLDLFQAKDLVGSQRVGFVYLIALWLVLLGEARSSTERLGRYGALFVLSAGLLLTFSRASIVALLGSAFLFVLGRPRGRLPRPTFKGTMRAFASVIGLILLAGTLYTLVPALFAFFSDHLFGLIASPEFEGRLSDPDSSEGGRIALAMQILDFVSRNPLTGTGYLGIWILPGALQGSAHNQFTDVLLRTGVPGLAMYLVLLVALLKQLYRRERSLFWGIIAVLMYGLLHETFKEPQGAFVLSFLLGWLAESTRMPRVARRPMGADTVPAPT